MNHDIGNSIDNCFVCSNYMGSCRNSLLMNSLFSEKSFYKFIEQFADVKLSKYVKSNAGICQDCLIKFEEYDQFITKAETIQQELLALFRNTRETFVYIKQERELDEDNDTVHIKIPEFEKLTKVPDVKFQCKTCDKNFRSLSHMNAHSHTTKSNKKSSTNFEDSDISQSFKKIAKKSGINYDIETFHKTFGFSPEAKANFSKTTIPIRKASNQNNTVSKNFEELSKLAGINYDVGVFHKAFGFTATEIASGQEKLTDSNNCEKSENESSSLKNARTVKVKIIKTPLESTEFRCEKCDKNFKSIEFMKVHFASDHDKIKTKLKCPDCDKILGDRANLRGHLAIHSETKKFFCDRCAKSFIHKESFRHHLLIHDNIRNFQCETCSKSFRTKGKLTRHSYIHTNQRNHVCTYCSAKFTQRFTMVLHIRKQHKNEEVPEIQVKCPICELNFAKNMLKQHLTQSHQVIND